MMMTSNPVDRRRHVYMSCHNFVIYYSIAIHIHRCIHDIHNHRDQSPEAHRKHHWNPSMDEHSRARPIEPSDDESIIHQSIVEQACQV